MKKIKEFFANLKLKAMIKFFEGPLLKFINKMKTNSPGAFLIIAAIIGVLSVGIPVGGDLVGSLHWILEKANVNVDSTVATMAIGLVTWLAATFNSTHTQKKVEEENGE